MDSNDSRADVLHDVADSQNTIIEKYYCNREEYSNDGEVGRSNRKSANDGCPKTDDHHQIELRIY